jgi:hypothetical protein
LEDLCPCGRSCTICYKNHGQHNSSFGSSGDVGSGKLKTRLSDSVRYWVAKYSLTVWSRSPEIKLVVDMKKKPHFGQRRCGELGRKASRKKAMTAGIMQTIMMMKRRLGFLSMRTPRAAKFGIS